MVSKTFGIKSDSAQRQTVDAKCHGLLWVSQLDQSIDSSYHKLVVRPTQGSSFVYQLCPQSKGIYSLHISNVKVATSKMIDSQLFFSTKLWFIWNTPTQQPFLSTDSNVTWEDHFYNVTRSTRSPQQPTFLGCYGSFGIARLGGGTDGCCYPGNLVASISTGLKPDVF